MHHGLSRRSLLAVLGAAAVVGAARAAGAQTPKPLRIALIPSDIAAEAYIAKDEGYFRRGGFEAEFTPITSGAAISAAVAGGAVDIGFANVVSLAIAHERGLPFQILSAASYHLAEAPTAGILTVAKTSPVRSAKDLNGKTVAINGLNNISDAAVKAWVDKNGGDAKTIKFTEMPFPQMPEAVRTGRVDAASIDAANEQELTKPDGGLRRLANVFDAVSPRFAPSTWFTTKAWVDAHPADARAFLAAIADAAKYGNANRAGSAEILARYLKKTPAEINAVTRAQYVTKTTPDLIQPSIDVAARYGLLKSAFPAADLLSPLAQ